MAKKMFSALLCLTMLCSTVNLRGGLLKGLLFGAGTIGSAAGTIVLTGIACGLKATKSSLKSQNSAKGIALQAAGTLIEQPELAVAGAAGACGLSTAYCFWRTIDEFREYL